MSINKPLISVIIPVYNASQYLESCIESVTSQSFKDIEIVLINDGSTDGSLQICNSYRDKDSRISVIDKQNGGVSSARNVGVKSCHGNYVIHVDADDTLLDDALINLYNKAIEDDSEIVIGNYLIEINSNTKVESHTEEKDPMVLLSLFLFGYYHAALWNKLIKKELYSGLEFVVGVDYMEDKLILTEMLLKKPKISFIENEVYKYIQRENSYSNNISLKSLESSKFVIQEIEKLLIDKSNFNDEIIYLKLHHKVLMLLKTSNKLNSVAKTFKEVNTYVFKSKRRLALKYEVLLFFEFYNIKLVTKLFKLLK